MKPFLVAIFLIVFGVVLNPLLPFVHILHEYFFHPAHRQKRRHAKKEWDHGTIEIPHQNTSGDTFWIERDVKYSEERDEYFLRNERPHHNGIRWEPNWNEVTSEKIKKLIQKQI